MFSKGTALPPRSLIALIIGITVVPLATLLWLGWRLLGQDRILESQQARQRVELSADLVVAALQRVISSYEQRLADGGDQWPEGTAMVTFRNGLVEASPRERVAFLPVVKPLREAPDSTFAQGEELEFAKRDQLAAIKEFRQLTGSPDPAVRAGALLRLARNLSGAGWSHEAFAAYASLSEMDGVAVGGVPTGLIGRYARCKLLEGAKRETDLRSEARLLDTELHSGRWTLTAPVYWLYASDASRWTGSPRERQAQAFGEAVGVLWERWDSMPAGKGAVSGRECLTIDGQALAVLWQTSGDSFRALLAATGFVQSQWLAAIAPVVKEQKVVLELRDSRGKSVFGSLGTGGALSATRSAVETALPWGVVAWSIDSPSQGRAFVLRRRLLIAGFVLLVTMALLASFLIFRAVSREFAVARLQSDFVSAVSHEFRTPLTALRQFTDMLREHGDLADDRRRTCYEAQSRATDRLTRLVESLLDFGRMEAGAHPYVFERRDCQELVARVVADFRSEAQAAGYRIAFCSNGPAWIEADSEALSRAIWNLLDNAVKYSPEHRTVEVGLSRGEATVSISVRDRGIGVPAHERAAIFARFQRGDEARTRGIKGTGIGLAMVEHIVEAHRGRVELESEPGKGSTFTIVLPAEE